MLCSTCPKVLNETEENSGYRRCGVCRAYDNPAALFAHLAPMVPATPQAAAYMERLPATTEASGLHRLQRDAGLVPTNGPPPQRFADGDSIEQVAKDLRAGESAVVVISRTLDGTVEWRTYH